MPKPRVSTPASSPLLASLSYFNSPPIPLIAIREMLFLSSPACWGPSERFVPRLLLSSLYTSFFIHITSIQNIPSSTSPLQNIQSCICCVLDTVAWVVHCCLQLSLATTQCLVFLPVHSPPLLTACLPTLSSRSAPLASTWHHFYS